MKNEFTRGHTHGSDSFFLSLSFSLSPSFSLSLFVLFFLFSPLYPSSTLSVYFHFKYINNKGQN